MTGKLREPEPSGFSKKQVFKFAEDIAKILKYDENLGIEKCVTKIGGTVHPKDFWGSQEKDGALIVQKIGDFDIFVPKHTSIERDRFTIAHELGHYFLHFLDKNKHDGCAFYATRYGEGRVEWEANWFAAGFLMPREKFQKALKKEQSNLSNVARMFGVSLQAVKVRKKDLGLDDDAGI